MTICINHRDLDALAEQIGLTIMQATDAEGRPIRPNLDISKLPDAVRAALTAMGPWEPLGDPWPTPAQLVPRRAIL